MNDDTYSVFAFSKDAPAVTDQRRRGIPGWKLPLVFEWARARGFDTVLVELTGDEASSSRISCHHVCSDALCPGGCD